MRVYFNRKVLFLFAFLFIICLYGLFVFNSKATLQQDEEKKIFELTRKIDSISNDLNENQSFLKKLQLQFHEVVNQSPNPTKRSSKQPLPIENHIHSSAKHQSNAAINVTIPVVVFVYNRPSVTRCLDLLLKFNRDLNANFPVVVSQDGNHHETTEAIQSYGNKVVHIRHPSEHLEIPPKHKRFQGYYKISSHYKWAISEIFERFPSSKAAIIVEDDLEISPDFFKYFLATYNLLLNDPMLYCVSAWNDNGKQGLIDEQASELLYRSDFFPGLGWMLTRSTWADLQPEWPASFWDDWIRDPSQRKDRSCIRPEIPRTKTFGRVGVSNGQFYDKHLKFIKLNDKNVNWQSLDLSYLEKERYDEGFVKRVLNLPEVTVEDIKGQNFGFKEMRVAYTGSGSFKSLAKLLGIMDDFKAGVPRTAYHGIVSVFYHDIRLYLTPGQPWNGYNVKWS